MSEYSGKESPGPRRSDLQKRIEEIDGVSVTLGPLVKQINEVYQRKSDIAEIQKIFDTTLVSQADRVFKHVKSEASVSREMIIGKMTHFLAFYGIQALFTTEAADYSNVARKDAFMHEIERSQKLPRGGESLGSPVSHPDVLLSYLFSNPLGEQDRSGKWSYAHPPKSDSQMFEIFKSQNRDDWWLRTLTYLLGKLQSSSQFGVLGDAAASEPGSTFAYFATRMKAGLTTVTTDGHLLFDFAKRAESRDRVREYLKSIGKETSDAAITNESKLIVMRSLIALHPVAFTSISVHRAAVSNKSSDFILVEGDIGAGNKGLFIVTPELQQLKKSSGALSDALKKALGHRADDRGTDAIACGCPLAYSPLMREVMKVVCDQLFK